MFQSRHDIRTALAALRANDAAGHTADMAALQNRFDTDASLTALQLRFDNTDAALTALQLKCAHDATGHTADMAALRTRFNLMETKILNATKISKLRKVSTNI